MDNDGTGVIVLPQHLSAAQHGYLRPVHKGTRVVAGYAGKCQLDTAPQECPVCWPPRSTLDCLGAGLDRLGDALV